MKPLIWENFEIEPFLEYLRISKGYNIGIYEHQIAQRLMLQLAESQNLPTTEEELVDFLMPILCKNSPQQYSFREDFREWTSIKPDVTQKIDNELAELEKSEKLKNTLKNSFILLGIIIGITLMVIAILVNPVNSEGGNTGNVNIPIPIYSFRFYAVIFFSAFAIAIIIVLINYFRALKAQKKDIDTYLNKRSINPDQAFYLNQLFAPELCQNFFLNQDLMQTAKKYNNPLKGESLEIDLEQTIQTVLNAGGYLQIIKKKVPRSPEYLILIDRKTYIDHQSKYIESLIDVLESFNVPMDVFYFSGDPRNSYSEQEEKTYNLAQLAQRFPSHNLLIFSAIKEFFNPVNLELKSWTQELYPWNAKALFTLDNPSVNTILFDLVAELIKWHPISPEGLEEYILSNSILSIEEDQSLPVLFQKNHLDWLEQQDHSNLDKKWIINELSNYLGEQGFKWLTTTAIYPEVNLNFTLYLGNTLSDASGTPFYTQSSFLKLIQLPWFRFGRMPDWLRMQLISEMPKSLEKEVRNAIFALFSVALKEPLSTFSLEYGSFVNETNTKLHKQLLKSLRQIYKNDSFLNDFIFEGFMEDTLSIKVPKLNEPKEESIPQKIDLNRSTHFLKQPKGFFTALYTLMSVWFFWGFIAASNGILIPMFKEQFNLQQWQSQLVDFAFYAAYFVGSILYFLVSAALKGDILNRIGYRQGIMYGFIISAVGTFLFIPAASLQSFPLLLGGLFVVGLGFSLQQTSIQPFMIALGDPATGAHRINLGGAVNNLGTTIGPMLISFVIFGSVGGTAPERVGIEAVKMPFLVIGLFFVLFALFFRFSKLPTITNDEDVQIGTGVLKYPQLVLGMIAIFCYVGAEVTIASNLGEYLKKTQNLDSSQISEYISLFWGSMMMGRWTAALSNFNFKPVVKILLTFVTPFLAFGVVLFVNALRGSDISPLYTYSFCVLIIIAAFFAAQEKPIRTMVLFSLLGGTAIIIGMLTSGQVALFAFISVGLFCSVLWPCIFSLATAGLGKYTNQGSAYLIMMILGGAVVPVTQGALADSIGIELSYAVPLLCFAYLLFFGIRVQTVLKNQGLDFDRDVAVKAGH